ncbi:MAG: GAF domain-containing protein [Desulfobacterales bacterium]|nr:GAF domain-containing protein [Desulfobacterales bacterium]
MTCNLDYKADCTERKSQYLDLFIKMTRTITSCLELKEVFGLIAVELAEIIQVDAVTVRLRDSSKKKLELKAAFGLSRAYLNRGAIDTEAPVFKALEGDPILISNAAEDDRIVYKDATRQEGIHTILVIPIKIRGEVEGVLRLLTKHPRKFEPAEIEFVSAIAEQCGIVIENARFVKQQETQLTYFAMIHDLGKQINATRDLGNILDLIVTRLPEIMNLKAATIRFFEQKGRLTLKASYGLSEAYLARGPLDREAATYYLKEGEPLIILDAKTDVHTIYHEQAKAEGIASVLAVPIYSGDEVMGILRLLTSEVRYFTEADISFAMAIAEHCGMAMQRTM